MPSSRSAPKKAAAPYHHGDLRRALLDAAFEILKADGPSALSLREVARRAGVSHQAPYHHFPSRGHLLAALAEEGFEHLAESLERVQAAATDPIRRSQDTGVEYVMFASRNPERFRLMFGAELGTREPYPELNEAAKRVFDLLVRPFGMKPQPARTPDQAIVLTLWSTVHGLAALAVDGQVKMEGKALEAAAYATTDRLWFGVRAALADAGLLPGSS